jgi:hypothetical protein
MGGTLAWENADDNELYEKARIAYMHLVKYFLLGKNKTPTPKLQKLHSKVC